MASQSSAHTWFFASAVLLACWNLSADLRDPKANQSQKASFFCLTASLIFQVHWCVLGLLPWQASTTTFQPQFKAAVSAIEALNPPWLHFSRIPWDKGIAPLKVGVKELWQDSLLKVPVHPHDLFGFPISPLFTWVSKTNSCRSKDMTMKSIANLEPIRWPWTRYTYEPPYVGTWYLLWPQNSNNETPLGYDQASCSSWLLFSRSLCCHQHTVGVEVAHQYYGFTRWDLSQGPTQGSERRPDMSTEHSKSLHLCFTGSHWGYLPIHWAKPRNNGVESERFEIPTPASLLSPWPTPESSTPMQAFASRALALSVVRPTISSWCFWTSCSNSHSFPTRGLVCQCPALVICFLSV